MQMLHARPRQSGAARPRARWHGSCRGCTRSAQGISMTNDSMHNEKALRIRTRRTVASTGVTTIARSVLCPRRAEERSPSACVTCPHCDAVMSSGREAYVYCDNPSYADAPRRGTQGLSPGEHAESLAKRTPITAIMTCDVACVQPDVALDVVAALVLSLGVDGVPVVDTVGQPLGIVSKTDLVGAAYDFAYARDQTGESSRSNVDRGIGSVSPTAADIMMDAACVLPETASVAEAAALFVDEPMERVLVTCAEGKLVGIVSTRDVVRWLVEQGD
jgi:CBS domain-containing protein